MLDGGFNASAVQRVLHVSGSTYRRLLVDGLSDWQADRAAIRLGFHPVHLWPGWVEAGLGVVDGAFLESGWRQAWLHKEAS